jgi:hypothetical protein
MAASPKMTERNIRKSQKKQLDNRPLPDGRAINETRRMDVRIVALWIKLPVFSINATED